MSKSYKTETVEEYLARGKTIKILPAIKATHKYNEVAASKKTGPVSFITLDEAALFFGEKPKELEENKKEVKTKKPKIDIEMLPKALKEKLLAKAKERQDSDVD